MLNTQFLIEILLVTLTTAIMGVKLPDFIIDIPQYIAFLVNTHVSLSKYSDATAAVSCRAMLTGRPS